MRFFTTNYLFLNFGGNCNASSNTSLASFAFNEQNSFDWFSSEENIDGDAVFLERTLDTPAAIDRIVVKNTNISNLTIEVDIGSGYNALTSFTLTKSNDGTCYFYELNSPISILKIKLIGSNTIIANQEKSIGQVLAFEELGNLKNVADIQPKRERIQVLAMLNTGKYDIINKGQQWSFKIKLKAHYRALDNNLIDAILQRKSEMWLWLNDDKEEIIVMSQEPYRFKDFYKVAFQKSDSPKFQNNMYYSGINVDFDLVEVA